MIDAHQHFWKYNTKEYPWIDQQMAGLKRDFLPEDLKPEMKKTEVTGTIAVQARQTLEETQWLLELARCNEFIKGVVGWVDLCSSQVKEQLKDISWERKLVGVRHVIHDEPDDNFMARADFRRGIASLSDFGLTYDLLIFPKHLHLATKLVQDFPNQTFVLDHIAKPDIRNKIFNPWASDLKKLAREPNVYCKLSGMVTEADWKNWHPSDFQDYLEIVFDYFGPERLMAGSDWPVCTVAGDYNEVIGLVQNFMKTKNIHPTDPVFGGNCTKAYNLT